MMNMLLPTLLQFGFGSLRSNSKKARVSSVLLLTHNAVWNWDPYWLASAECTPTAIKKHCLTEARVTLLQCGPFFNFQIHHIQSSFQRPQIQGVKTKGQETYLMYGDCHFVADNAVDEVIKAATKCRDSPFWRCFV
jgi:hypothetical protein